MKCHHFAGFALALAMLAGMATGGEPIEIGDRLEPFVDLYLVDTTNGVTHPFHRPIEIRNLENPPSGGYYATVILDGGTYRHYCREKIPGYTGSGEDGNPGEVTVYEESSDGIHWTRPNLGLFEVNGSRSNNYILAGMSPFSHNFSPFLDTRPGCPPAERFKALAGTQSLSTGLVAFVSADGTNWARLRDAPVLAPAGSGLMFDSQNVSFWSAAENQYIAYCRRWTNNLRTVVRSTSPDFLAWSPFAPVPGNLTNEHLYTSQAHPYFRAPHITVGLATRFLPNLGESTDIVLLSSRDGLGFDRVLKEAFIRPSVLRASWGNRANYAALNVFPLKNDLPGVPEELRYTQPEFMGMMVRDRIYYLPVDGFASIHASFAEGQMVTKPLRFAGNALFLNHETSPGGYIRVEIQDADGQAIPGYALADMGTDLRGNARAQRVAWRQGGDVGPLAGQAIRLRVVMRQADLYAFRFGTD
jgi:hypothetical protein